MVTITFHRYTRDEKTGFYGSSMKEFKIKADDINSAWELFENEMNNNDVFRYMPLHITNIHETK